MAFWGVYLLLAASALGGVQLSVDDDLALLSLFGSPVYIESLQPVLVCPACTVSAPGAEPLFSLTGVTMSVHPDDYQPGVDLLHGVSPRNATNLPFQNFEYAFDPKTGTMRIGWADASLHRPAWELSAALRAISFSSRGQDPTLRGTSFSRRIRIVAAATDGSVAWPERVQAVQIQGRNEAPLCVVRGNAPPEPTPAVVFTEGSSQRALLWPAGVAALAAQLSDVDDALLTAAEVYFSRGAGLDGGGAALLSEDALAAWDPLTDPDPTGGAIALVPFNATSGALRLQGAATPLQYAAALATVGYINTNAVNPTLAPQRTIFMRVWDARASEPTLPSGLPCARPAVVTAAVAPINSPPTLAWHAGQGAVSAHLSASPVVYHWNFRAPVALAPFTAPSGPLGVALSDADDAWLTGLTLSVCSGTCMGGEDVLGVDEGALASALPLPLSKRFNASTCTLAVAFPPTSRAHPSAIAQYLIPALQYSNSASGGRALPSPHTRTLCLSVRDGGVGGAPAPLTSDPLMLPIGMGFPSMPPQVALVGSGSGSGSSSSGGSSGVGSPLWVLEGAAGGTPVQGGHLAAWDDSPAAGAALGGGGSGGGSSVAQFFFFVTGGTGEGSFFVDPHLGTLFVQYNANLSAALLGRNPTVEVTVADTFPVATAFSPPRGATKFTLSVALVEGGGVPALLQAPGQAQGGGSPPSLPPGALLPAPFLLHGTHSALCLDLAAVFSTPLPLLNISLHYFDAAGEGAWVEVAVAGAVAGAGGAASPAPSSSGSSGSGGGGGNRTASVVAWSPLDPPRWGRPSPATSAHPPTVHCLFGTPLILPPHSTAATGAAPAAALPAPSPLRLALLASTFEPRFPHAAAAAAAAATAAAASASSSPLPLPPFSLWVPWEVPVNVGGCRDPGAAYSPCMRDGRIVEDGAALAAMAFAVGGARGEGGPFDAPPCDNFCVDTQGNGLCDNACPHSMPWSSGSGASSSSAAPPGTTPWGCAANPGGNFNPAANVDLPLPFSGALCVYPPRLFTATMLWPPLPFALSSYAQLNEGGGQGRASPPPPPLPHPF